MKKYVEFEFNRPFIEMPDVFYKIHGYLNYNEKNIGISFPMMNKTPGGILRCFSDEKTLNKLMKMIGYYSDIKSIPKVVNHGCYLRSRIFSRCYGKERDKRVMKLLKHLIKNGIEPDLERINSNYSVKKKSVFMPPFLNIKSKSNGQSYRFYIKMSLSDNEKIGEYTSYGLAGENMTTVPIF